MLTVYGIETVIHSDVVLLALQVATVLTVYGIETRIFNHFIKSIYKLQQCLPFTVLKQVQQDESSSTRYF